MLAFYKWSGNNRTDIFLRIDVVTSILVSEAQFGIPPHQERRRFRLLCYPSYQHISTYKIYLHARHKHVSKSKADLAFPECLATLTRRLMLTKVKSIQALPLRPSFRRVQSHYETLLTILHKEPQDMQWILVRAPISLSPPSNQCSLSERYARSCRSCTIVLLPRRGRVRSRGSSIN